MRISAVAALSSPVTPADQVVRVILSDWIDESSDRRLWVWTDRVRWLMKRGWPGVGSDRRPDVCMPPPHGYGCRLHTCVFCHARRARVAYEALAAAVETYPGYDAAVLHWLGTRKASLRRTLAAGTPAAYTWSHPYGRAQIKAADWRNDGVALVEPTSNWAQGRIRTGPAAAGGLAEAVQRAFAYPPDWARASVTSLIAAERIHASKGHYWAGYGACRAGYAGRAVGTFRHADGPPVTATFPVRSRKN